MSSKRNNTKRASSTKAKAATTSKGFDATAQNFAKLSVGAAAPAAPSSKGNNKGNKNKAKAPVPAVSTADAKFSAEQNELRALLGACVSAPDTASAVLGAEAFAAAAANMGVAALGAAEVTSLLASKTVLGSKNKLAREGGVLAVSALVAKLGAPCVGALMAIVPTVLALTGDKKGANVRPAATAATLAIFEALPNEAVPVYIQECILKKKTGGLASLARPETKVTALQLLSAAAKKAPREVEGMMTVLVPIVSKAMWDVKKAVKEQAEETLEDICGSIDNIDITPFIPNLVDAIADPETVPDCIYSLAGTTFVQTVTASALSITVPLLKRGFNDKKTAIKRKCAVITENMAKLVKNPAEVAPFMPVLQPLLALGIEQIADPECRARFTAAEEVLTRVGTKGKQTERKQLEEAAAVAALRTAMQANGAAAASLESAVVTFCGQVCMSLGNVSKNFIKATWNQALTALLAPCFADGEASAAAAVDAARTACAALVGETSFGGESKEYVDPEPEIEDLCNLEFSLAYGSKILLNNSRLHLKKGFKYGVMSEKSAGKTTMMRAISNQQVEGFPYEGVRTIFIENDIQGSQLEMTCTEFLRDSIGFGIKVTLEEANAKLLEGGFTQVMCDGLITQLSGGWKMKIALIRATMEEADIMLMDEPTNHLDVLNVQWVVDYINSLPEVTCIIVSHDTSFLDKTVSHIIHFEDLKLHTYKGNITAFVERFPEAKSYFDLANTREKFKFPQPALLDGVKTKGTAILQMINCDFKYPGAAKNQINNVTVKASMASRVAIVGANGAGKSTLIKLLTGENKPTKGTVKKHPNCRFAYVAQHAFHHIEQHLEKSPNEYIRWRYEGGEDKEARAKTTAIITDEEKAIMEKPFEVSWKDEETGALKKEKRVVKKLMARRKVKKDYHYEVNWKGKSMDFNSWYPREDLVKRGFLKWIKALDSRMAAAQQQGKPLTARNVEEHLGNVGLQAEEATHSRIKDLSGGQKVKVVLAACTWCCPHIIILDEPTNYLDRDSLGALANAIDEFEGGVVLITHNKEFADATTKVTWVVANNRCDVKGDPEWEKYAAEQEVMQDDPLAMEYFDAAGNKIDPKNRVKKIEEMTKQEIKKMKKTLKQKIKRGQELDEHEYDYCDEWNIKYTIAE
jgi:elongation factor 3